MPEAVDKVPPKLIFVNIQSGAEVKVQFNPTQFQESISANYDDQKVPGQSHEPSQFVNTTNFKLQFEITFKADSPGELKAMNRARRHMLSWCYPRNVSSEVVGGGAPRILVVWPQMLSLECTVRSCRIQHKMFNSEGSSVYYTAFLSIAEIRDFRLTFDEVAEDNQLRFGNDFGLEGP